MPLAPRIALLTESRYVATSAAPDDWYLGNILRDDGLLQAALDKLGLSSVRVDWTDRDVDWAQFQCAVFRTTWNYHERFTEFSDWLRQVEIQTRLCNAASLIWWNLDKHYMADLAACGVPIIESEFISCGEQARLQARLDASGWTEAVIKPCISAAARHTYRFNRVTGDEITPTIDTLLQSESLILQPFQDSIQKFGEITLMMFGGRYSHAVRKVPRAGDFRVQDDHGGSVHEYRPSCAEIELAERAIAACRPAPAYGRVDLVTDNHGHLAVMELELIEPELWLRSCAPSATAFAESIVKTLHE